MKNTILLLFIFLFFACNKDIVPIDKKTDIRPELIKKYSGIYIKYNNSIDTLKVYSLIVDSLSFKFSLRPYTVPLMNDTNPDFFYNIPSNYKNKFRVSLNDDFYIVYDFLKYNFLFKNDTFFYSNLFGNSYKENKKDGSTSPYRSEYTSPIFKYVKVK